MLVLVGSLAVVFFFVPFAVSFSDSNNATSVVLVVFFAIFVAFVSVVFVAFASAIITVAFVLVAVAAPLVSRLIFQKWQK